MYKLCIFFLLTFMIQADSFFITVGGINGQDGDHKLEGQFGTIYKSSDLKEWQEAFKGGPVKEGFSHARNNMLRCMTYGNGVFVAIGNPKCIIRSTDGSKWEQVPAPHGAFSISYGNGKFLAATAENFMTSTDGKEWTTVKQKADFKVWGKDGAGHIRKTIFGNGVFLVYGESRLGITKDCKTFIKHEIIKDPSFKKSMITFGSGKFIWLNPVSGHKQSTDGVNWKPLQIDENTRQKQTEILWTGEKFLVKAEKFILSSIDGNTWEKKECPNPWFRLITYGNGKIVNFAGWDSMLLTSEDEGKTWSPKRKLDLQARRFYFFNGKEIIGHNGG